MKYQYRVLEYLSITSFVWGLYLLFLIPFQLLVVKMPYDMFITWITLGTMAEMIIAYPIAKAITRYVPKITLYWDRVSKRYE